MGKFLDLTRKKSEDFKVKPEFRDEDQNKQNFIIPKNQPNNAYFSIIGLLVLVLFYSIYTLSKNSPSQSPSPSQSQISNSNYMVTPAPTPREITSASLSPSQSPTQTSNFNPGQVSGVKNEIDKASISIKILNGSGKNGLAAQIKQELLDKGFKIEAIGNAKNTYNSTFIYYNQNKKDQAQLITDALPQFQTTLQENPTLANQYDVLLVLGTR